jgi:hypothetical protein
VTTNREFHYRYGIAALILALCAAIGFGLYDDPRLVDKVSFALTVNSLVLSVVAIVYSFMASNKQDIQLAKLVETNAQISSAASDISATSKEMNDHLKELPKRLDNVDQHLIELNNAALQTSSAAINAQLTADDPNRQEAPGGKGFTEYLTELTFAGIGSNYLYYKALVAGQVITPEMCENEHLADYLFQIGNLQAAEASGYLEADYSLEKITPRSMAETAKESIQRFVTKSREIFDADHHHIKTLTAIDEMLPDTAL